MQVFLLISKFSSTFQILIQFSNNSVDSSSLFLFFFFKDCIHCEKARYVRKFLVIGFWVFEVQDNSIIHRRY